MSSDLWAIISSHGYKQKSQDMTEPLWAHRSESIEVCLVGHWTGPLQKKHIPFLAVWCQALKQYVLGFREESLAVLGFGG